MLHIGTHSASQRRGHARELLRAVLPALDLHLLQSETDGDAVGFYGRAGFEINPMPSRWPGSRYLCTLAR